MSFNMWGSTNYAKWKKPDREDHRLYGSIHKKFREGKYVEIESRWIVAWGWSGSRGRDWLQLGKMEHSGTQEVF